MNDREDRFSAKMLKTPPSGIRKFFDLIIGRDDIISLGVGEPDFATPWTMRAITSAGSECASAQASEPSEKMAIAHMNTRRVPKWSAAQPLTGMNTVSASRYADTPTDRCAGAVPKSRAIAGSEVAITVASRFSMKNAAATSSAVAVETSWLPLRETMRNTGRSR